MGTACRPCGESQGEPTGLLLFAVHPADYLGNAAFLWKMALIALAGANAFLFQWFAMEAVRPFLAGLSFTAWILVLLAGRTIGFV